MPWQETDPIFERLHFAQDLASGQWTMTERCTRYGISRNTGCKWRDRLLALGLRGLEEQSRAPLSSPNATPQATIELILTKHSRYRRSARNILKRLQTSHPHAVWPARSTIAEIFARHDRVRRRRSRTHWKHAVHLAIRSDPSDCPCRSCCRREVAQLGF